MIKLIAFQPPSLPSGLGSLGNVVCDKPPNQVRGWRVLIRGPAVYLVSPHGWSAGKPFAHFVEAEPRQVFEVARADCKFQFAMSGDDLAEIDKLQRYDSDPMGVVAPEIDLDELERQTAPKAVRK